MPKPEDVPNANYPRTSLRNFDLPGIGEADLKDDRNIWEFRTRDHHYQVVMLTDRHYIAGREVGTVPRKGTFQTQLSDYMMRYFEGLGLATNLVATANERTRIVRLPEMVLPVDLTFSRILVDRFTSTSIWANYGENYDPYGLKLPSGLEANRAFPRQFGLNGVIVTHTLAEGRVSRASMLTQEAAIGLVAQETGARFWRQARDLGYQAFEAASKLLAAKGVILADTKFSFGQLDGEVVILDNVFKFDSHSFIDAKSYAEKINAQQSPDFLGVDLAEKYLTSVGFMGRMEQRIPSIPTELIQTGLNYRHLSSLITREGVGPVQNVNTLTHSIMRDVMELKHPS